MTKSLTVQLTQFVDAQTGETAWSAECGPWRATASTVTRAIRILSQEIPALWGEGIETGAN